ncbi:MAG TPA: phosphoenolpyruvate carboxykinase (ATP) [Acetobacteraceae bacterium]|nr:phosphoenolpyruvate carboxykinase (ATP) [Acetobacteraceae bacterium]
MTHAPANQNAWKKHAADALAGTGVQASRPVHSNQTAPALVAESLRRNEGRLSVDGALMVETGVHTGRSVQDKFVADEPSVTNDIWWGKINQRMPVERFNAFKGRVQAYLQGQELFTQDLYAGADPEHRVRVRLVTTHAWIALFARNMFIRPLESDLPSFEPDYVILHAPLFQTDPKVDGVRSSTTIGLSFEQKLIIIAGSEYAGEVKKSIFTIMNWLLPPKGVMPMHCSANQGKDGDVALFFGLSGTGKTTLSSDPHRKLIGDDEHGWGPTGTFNFEGGCYAKVINLSQEAEPEIWAASNRFGSVLENVIGDKHGNLDLTDGSLTENTRSCYPVEFIPNVNLTGRGGQPKNVFMLTCDAFGVLPPISRLTPAQAMYHFLSGYTAQVAGTEKGLGKEPNATFSTCFAHPFIPRRPEVYGQMFSDLIAKYGATCWLVNTGWSGGQFGVGHRMAIRHTRALLRGALDGSLTKMEFHKEPFFGLSIPAHVPGIPDEVLDPRQAWADKSAYDRMAKHLIERFETNFAAFEAGVGDDVKAVAIRVAV